MLSERIGNRIAELRLQKGLTQLQLARKSNIDRSYLCNIENGKSNIFISSLYKICKGLDVSLAEFFECFKKDICPDILQDDTKSIVFDDENMILDDEICEKLA